MDASNRSVHFLKPGMLLDFGAIAKGYAVDRAAASLAADGFHAALIQAGGSICALGMRHKASPWKIGIQHPRASGPFHIFALENLSVATSGDYQIFFEHEGRRYHHLLNPRTGEPVRRAVSVTVTAQLGVVADAYSTAIMVWSDEENFESRVKRAAETKHLSIVVVAEDGTVWSVGQWGRMPERLDLREAHE